MKYDQALWVICEQLGAIEIQVTVSQWVLVVRIDS